MYICTKSYIPGHYTKRKSPDFQSMTSGPNVDHSLNPKTDSSHDASISIHMSWLRDSRQINAGHEADVCLQETKASFITYLRLGQSFVPSFQSNFPPHMDILSTLLEWLNVVQLWIVWIRQTCLSTKSAFSPLRLFVYNVESLTLLNCALIIGSFCITGPYCRGFSLFFIHFIVTVG